jgi:hypothetical protein
VETVPPKCRLSLPSALREKVNMPMRR